MVAAVTWGWRSGLSTRKPGISTFFALILYFPILLPLYSLSSGGNRLVLSVDAPYLFLAFPIAFASFSHLALFAANVFSLPTTLDVVPSFTGYSLVQKEKRVRVRDYYTPFAMGFIISILTVALGAYLIADPAAYALTNGQGRGLGSAGVVLGGLGFIFCLWVLVTSPAEYTFLYHLVSFAARGLIDLTIYLTRREIGLPGALAIGAGIDLVFAAIDVFYWQTGFGVSDASPRIKSSMANGYRTPSPLSLNNTYKWSIIYSAIFTSLPFVMYIGSSIGVQVGAESRAARATWTALIVFALALFVYGGLYFFGSVSRYMSVEAQKQADRYFAIDNTDVYSSDGFEDNDDIGPEDVDSFISRPSSSRVPVGFSGRSVY